MKDLECLGVRLLESFPFPVWRSGCDAKRDYFNRKWLDFTGRTLQQEVGDGWSAGIHPDDFGCGAAKLPGCIPRSWNL